MANRKPSWWRASLIGLFTGATIGFVLPASASSQSGKTSVKNPVNVPRLGPIANHPQPVQSTVRPTRTEEKQIVGSGLAPKISCLQQILKDWTITASGLYQFSNQRSRVGGVSLNTESGGLDIAASRNYPPFTSIDLTYLYSYASGSSVANTSQTWHQNAGSMRIFQPLNTFFDQKWVPPSGKDSGEWPSQFAVLVDAGYGGADILTRQPATGSLRNNLYTFIGDALLDVELGWFPKRGDHYKWSLSRLADNPHLSDPNKDYPSLFLELSSGAQFATTRLESSGPSFTSTSGRQITYRNIASVVASLPNGFGALVAAEWDAPLYSDPLRGSTHYYANTATFSAGIVYNYFGTKPQPNNPPKKDPLSHFSVGLIYSYTAFDPFTETNQLQVQFSYTF
jgi:hypothetical protein